MKETRTSAHKAFAELDETRKRHGEEWYAELGRSLGHPGHVTLEEIEQAEADGWVPGIEALAEVNVQAPAQPRKLGHQWYAQSWNGKHWVFHSTHPQGHTIDSFGVSADRLGPFSSRRLADEVAGAMNDAYQVGRSST